MKVKQQASDFVVEERADLAPAERGRWSLYRMTKEHIGTLEAVSEISRAWKVSRRAIGVCGLKDRHAQTTQFVTIDRGPERDLDRDAFRLEYLGKSGREASPAALAGNSFAITVRDLAPDDAREFRDGLLELGRKGLPNYFDEQRFGSAVGGRFVARGLLEGDYEGALRLAIATPSPDDDRERRQIRSTLDTLWGKWDRLAEVLPRSSERSIVTYLRAHPERFDRAFALIDSSMRFLLVSAYQSYLWNRALAMWVSREHPRVVLRKIEHWDWPFPDEVTDEESARWRARTIPLPAPKMEGEGEGVVREVLSEEGFEPRRLRFKRIKDSWFGRGRRPAWLVPGELTAEEPAADELNAGKEAVRFSCVLPKGSYATLLTRRLLGTWKRGRLL